MRLFDWQSRLQSLQTDVHALWLAYRDPRVPWYARILAACVLAYALSPVDLIPDFIPVVGHLDDVILVPLGVLVTFELIPAAILTECRQRAKGVSEERRPLGWVGAAVIVSVWIGLVILVGWVVTRAALR